MCSASGAAETWASLQDVEGLQFHFLCRSPTLGLGETGKELQCGEADPHRQQSGSIGAFCNLSTGEEGDTCSEMMSSGR